METPSANPLRLIAMIALICLATDALRLYSQHTLSFVAIARVILNAGFLVLYVRRSMFAWHVALAVGPMILVVYLFLYLLAVTFIDHPITHAR